MGNQYLPVFVGGLDIKAQEAALRQSPDIVIATPGRLIDHLRNAPSFNLANIEVLVLDEADRLVTKILSLFNLQRWSLQLFCVFTIPEKSTWENNTAEMFCN